jgi:hypothetical protein
MFAPSPFPPGSAGPAYGLTATGLSACLAAASQHAIKLLLVPTGGLIPGYACQRCGALSSTETAARMGRRQRLPCLISSRR